MAEGDEEPKIHVDNDWKAEAQREKERLAEQAKSGKSSEGQGGGDQQLPPATFETLMSTLATQALFALGAIADPGTGQTMENLPLARHHIDLLGVLEEKTEGNLTEEESNLLRSTLYELRSRYIQATSGGPAGGDAASQAGPVTPS